MSSLDAQQVTLTLTRKPFILNELKRKGRIGKDPKDGKSVFRVQFDSKTFEFREDNSITVGKSAGECLIDSSLVICGNHIDGEVHPALEVTREFDLSEGEKLVLSPTTCSFCKEDQRTARGLAEHIIESHSENSEADTSKSHESARSRKSANADA